MPQKVKIPQGGEISRTRVSSKHQVTIAKPAFDQAGLRGGDELFVRALGPGRVELTRLEDLCARHRGRLATGGALRRTLDELRADWD